MARFIHSLNNAPRRAVFVAALSYLVAAISGCDKGADNRGGAQGSGTASGQVKQLVFLANGEDPFWDTCYAGMEKAAKDLKIADAGYKISIDKGSEFKAEKQLAKLEQYATQSDIAAVAVSSLDENSEAIANALRALQKKGVKVICVDADMSRKLKDARFAYLGTNNLVAGEELGKAAKNLRAAGGNYATFVGQKTVANAIGRINGFAKGAGPAFKEIDSMADEGKDQICQRNVAAVLDKHKDVNTLVGIWAYNAHAIVKIADERKIRDKTTIVVFDAAELALSDMEAGKIDAMIVQNPYQMGQLSVKMMKALVEDDHQAIHEVFPDYDPAKKEFSKPDGDILETELRVVVPNDKSPLKPEMFREKTQFFYYPKFKKWLDERQLISS